MQFLKWLFGKTEYASANEARMKQQIALHPEAMDLTFQASELVQAGRVQSALRLVDQAIEISPEAADAFDVKAECLNLLNDPISAINAATKATKLEPRLASAWVQLSWANIALKNLREGLGCAERAIAIDDKNDMAWNNAAVSLSELGQSNKAKEYALRAIELNPQNGSARALLRLLGAGLPRRY